MDILQCRSCWQVAAAPITMVLSHTATRRRHAARRPRRRLARLRFAGRFAVNSRGGRGLQNLRYMYLAEEIRTYVYIQLYILGVYIQGQIHVKPYTSHAAAAPRVGGSSRSFHQQSAAAPSPWPQDDVG